MIKQKTTPAVVTLAAMALAAAGFYGGAEVQKSHGDEATAGAPAARLGGAASSAPGGAAATSGTVKAVGDGTLTVTTSDGKSVRVKTAPGATVTRNAKAAAAAVHPGDAVVIDGTTGGDGTVTAASVTASSAG